MVRDGIRDITFAQSGANATSGDFMYPNANGIVDVYTRFPIVGQIVKVGFDNAASANGSVILTTSGAITETILNNNGGFNADLVVYPRNQITDNQGGTIGDSSGNVWTDFDINTHVHIVGSGLGSPGSLSAKVYYRNPQ